MFSSGLFVTELEAADFLPLVIPNNEIEIIIREPAAEAVVLMLLYWLDFCQHVRFV